MPYLLKSEPDAYSFSNLEHDRETIWDGVTNPAAVKNLRDMKPADRLIIYHTGKERQAVGAAEVIHVDASDPKNPKVKIKSGKRLPATKGLADIKQHRLFSGSPLVTQGRLSVVPLTEAQYRWFLGDD